MKISNKLIIVMTMIISTTTFWGCKKEIIRSTNSTPIKYQNRYQGEIFTDTRSYENAILAIEYELNMEVADTNMMSGATEYGNVFIDSFYYDAYTFTGDEVTGLDQEGVYEDIRDIILDSLNNYYDDTDAGNVFVVDLRVDDFNENRIIVKYGHAAKMTGCGCSFTSNLPWSDLNIDVKNCSYFDDKANNYYANCIAVRENIGQYYDVIIDEHPNSGIVYFTGDYLTSAIGPTIYLDGSMTPTEQTLTRDYLYDYWEDYTLNNTDERNNLLKVYIGGTVGNQNALYLDHLIRAKYSIGMSF